MLEKLPSDPVLLLSVVNTKLRDYYDSLEALCEDLQEDKESILHTLDMIDYYYDEEKNQFV